MQVGEPSSALTAARDAFRRSDWAAAFDAFERAEAEGPLGAHDLECAALSAMWLGEFEPCTDRRQRAFSLYLAGGDEPRAAGLAIDLCFDFASRHREAVAIGWAQRAEQLLVGCGPCAELGRLAELRGTVALHLESDAAAALEGYEEAIAIGRASNDADVVASGLIGAGTAMVRMGRVREGLRLVDDAMIDAVSGRLGPVATARIYCNTISLCQSLGDIRRAFEWTEQAVACSTRPGMGDFPGDCRMHRAEITRLRGDWTAAESELRSAMTALERWSPDHVGQAWYELGEIELRRGDLGAAGASFDRASAHHKDPQPGLAMLKIALGENAVASALLRVAAENAGAGDPLAIAELLPAMVEVQLACGDLTGAQEAASRLAELADVYDTVLLHARAATGRARVALADAAPDDAIAWARAALNLWRDADTPYEAAQTRCLLAEASARTGAKDVAIVELDAALVVFRNLGARRDIELAQTLRDRLGDIAVGRQVRRTFMFTDIVDSTRLVAEMGDVDWSAVLRDHDRVVRDELTRHTGAEVKQRGGGDGFFAVFEQPTDAIRCAVEIQRGLERQRRDSGFAPEIRIGVHEADALLIGNDYAGLGVHEAARIAAHARGDSILASRATAEAAPVDMPVGTPVHDVAFKGLSATLAVQEIPWRAPDNEVEAS